MQDKMQQLKILAIERRPEACLGCGFEQGCSVHGCAVINALADELAAWHKLGPSPEAVAEKLEQLRADCNRLNDFGQSQCAKLLPQLAELRLQLAIREHPQPLTLDELRQMDGQPVWVDDWYLDTHGWELSVDASDYFDERDADKYGGLWIAYRYPPKDSAP